jgi:hypothetical protein
VSVRAGTDDCIAILFFAYTCARDKQTPGGGPISWEPLGELSDISEIFGAEYFKEQFVDIRESAVKTFSVVNNDPEVDVEVDVRTRCYEWGGVVKIYEVHLSCSLTDAAVFCAAVDQLARVGIADYQKADSFRFDGTAYDGRALLTKFWGQDPVAGLWSGRARSLTISIRPLYQPLSDDQREGEVVALALNPFANSGVNLKYWKDQSRYIYLQPFNNWAGCIASEGSALVLDESEFNRQEFRRHLTEGYSFVIGEAVAETAAVTDLLCQPWKGRLSSTAEMEKYNELLERRSNDGLIDQIVSVGFREAFEQVLQTEHHFERAGKLMNARVFLGSAKTDRLISRGGVFFALFGVVQTIALFFPVYSTVSRPTAAAISILPTFIVVGAIVVLTSRRKRDRR